MTRQIIVVGDALAPFGGEVLTGAATDVVDGRAIARREDIVRCNEHGINQIMEGEESFMMNGAPAALEGHRAKCGCVLVSRHTTLSIS
ncbi:PAAR domain-containing protein [Burkholderia diffusa]|uniref:PAAR domain-containing protein n=1 Tax=Burkholderia diffusa TaxID=488732 RepID=UPI0009BF1268|nr:PAAR domain-containing protein [Burkholderia diffusa]